MCEDVEALGGELEDDVLLRRLLWGPLVGFSLRLVEGDLVAPSPAVVGKEAEDGVLLPVLLTRSRGGPATGRCGDTHR